MNDINFKFAHVSGALAGEHVLVPAVAGRKIRKEWYGKCATV